MSRPNNPQPQYAARPLPGHLSADQDAQAWNGAQARAQQPHQQPAQGYAQPYAYQPEVPPAGPYAQPAPADPFAGTPYAAQPAQPPRQAPAYAPAPQHDPYAQAQAAQPQAYGAAPAAYGHPQWPAPGGQAADPAGYDLSGYAVGGGNPGYDMGRQAPQQRGQWGADPYGAAEPSFEPPMYANPQQHGGTVEQTYAEEDAAYEMEPPRGRSRKFATVLLGAVIVGGGLTYAYSALMGPASDGAPPVVKGAEGPFKVKPSEPGGKQFAHTDSKVMGRLGDNGQPSASSEADSSGTRRVPVLTVGRDGSIQAPSEEPSPQRATVAVPGMTVIGGLGGPPPPRAQTAESKPASESKPQPEPVAAKITTAAEPEAPVVVTPPKKPEVTASVAAPAAPAPQSLSEAADASAGAAPEQPKKAPAPKKTAAVSPPPVAAQPAAPTGAGWVAVLLSVPASDKSRMDALKQFADMQQKYGGILQNKTPDIQEANLGEKGTYHRLMVGPPGSRETASELCTQLKAQGYPSCWVTAY